MPSKQFYSIAEVSELLSVTAPALRYWEKMFPMFNPNRLPSGQRRFTVADVKMARRIKELVYVKGLKIENAVALMDQTYRVRPPRRLRKCETSQDAIALLDEVKPILEDAHALAKIESVVKFLNTIGDVEK